MNNMQKAFDKKSALRRIHMADGGLVDKAKQDLGNRAATIDAAASGVPTPKPAPAPAPKPAQPSEDAQRAAVGMAPKKGFLRSLLGMAEGGHVRGPGGPREDKVPAMLSNGEYVLPAKTVQKLGGAEELDELVQHTNDGKAPKGAEERGERHSGLRMATGGAIEIDANGRPMTNGVNVLRGNQLATIPGQGPFTPPPVQPTPPRGPAGAMDYERMGPRPSSFDARTPPPTGAAGAMDYERIGPRPTPTSPTAAAPKAGTLSRAAGGLRQLASTPAAAAIGGITGAVQSYNDIDNGYRDQFNKSVGATSPVGTAGADALRTMGNVGNAITLGYAGKLGQGISSAMNGGSFSDGFSAPTDRDAFLAAKEAPKPTPGSVAGNGGAFGPPGNLSSSGVPTDAAPSPRSLAQSRYLSEQGVDVATQDSAPVAGDLRGLKTQPGQFLNLGSFQGADNIYGTSSKPGGRVNSFVGAGDPNRQETPQTLQAIAKLNSDLATDKAKTAAQEEAQRQAQASQGNSGSINARFDAMANKVAGSYSPMGKGNENKRLLEIETQRNNALEADARNNASIRGQNQQFQIAQQNNAVQARGQDLQLQGHQATLNQGLAIHRDTLGQQDRVFGNTVKQQAKAQEEQNVKDRTAAVDKLISRRFPDANKSGSPDGEKAIDYQNFIAKQDPKLVDAYTKGNATQRDEALSTIDRLFETREKVNARGSSSLRGNTSLDTVLPVGNARNVEFGDYWGQGSLPWSNLPRRAAAVVGADAGKVQQMSNGQLVPLNDLTNDDSSVISNGKNASKVSALHQQRAMQAQLEAEARRKQLESIIQKR